ncbi:MAG: hypothetical protein EZS28_010256 [Streblomastix strix]|uniref:Uncharacterized protein n=1 Tax=Streblomastix strix TaxID=222440 RepID=A0A5J4WGW5_9EUKA|nr:MAG: hypothetical protein EZS28_010256 [Streblomastix strix]
MKSNDFSYKQSIEQNIPVHKSEKLPKIDHSQAGQEEITEKSPKVEFDSQIAPDQLIINITNDICKGLKQAHEGEINTEEMNLIINKLSEIQIDLANELHLRSTEIIHAAILLSRVWTNKGRQITFQNLPMTTIGALVLANKYSADITIPIRVWGKILGVSAGKIHQWMMDMLDSLDFQLEVEREEFERISNEFSS